MQSWVDLVQCSATYVCIYVANICVNHTAVQYNYENCVWRLVKFKYACFKVKLSTEGQSLTVPILLNSLVIWLSHWPLSYLRWGCKCLFKDFRVGESIAENQWLNPMDSCRVLDKLLCQKTTQWCSKQVYLNVSNKQTQAGNQLVHKVTQQLSELQENSAKINIWT